MRKCKHCGWEYDPITAKECRDCGGLWRDARNCLACGETGREHTCMANQAINTFREGMRAAKAKDEIAWMIEMDAAGHTLYWSEQGFCSIANHGERFPTRQEAEEMARTIKTPTRVCEHLWTVTPHRSGKRQNSTRQDRAPHSRCLAGRC